MPAKLFPTFELEDLHGRHGLVAGVDEVGRGPWAGPVVTAAVILPEDRSCIPEGINDSKKMTLKKREILFDQIQAIADIGIGMATVEEIDSTNILAATKCAMARALHALAKTPAVVLVDGNQLFEYPDKSIVMYPIIKGDSISLSIAAASIIAKVTRDRIMAQLAQDFPHYAWEKNVGYGTKDHQEGLKQFGVTKHHRKSFKPIADTVLQSSY